MNTFITKGMRTFTIIWAGQLVSLLGSGLTSFALGVWIYQTTGSVILFAISLLVWILPNIAFSPLAGVVTDRFDRRLVMIFSDTGAGLSSLFVAIMLMTSHLEVWHVYLAMFFNAAFNAFQWPAYSAAISLLVPKQHLGRASGMTQASEAISGLITPALAGALFVSKGLGAILVIDVATYLVALGTLSAVRFPQTEPSLDSLVERQSFWNEALYGWRYIRARAGLFGLLIVFASLNFIMSATYPLLTPMLLDMTSPDVLGYVSSAAGAGGLAGTLLLSAWGGPKQRVLGIFAAEVLAGLFSMMLGLSSIIPLVAAANFAMMLVLPVSSACSQANWQTKVAADVQGRVFAIRRMIAFSIMPLAYALSGPLAEKVFEPAMLPGGALAPIFGPLLGTGPGRGIGLMFVIGGVLYMAVSSLILLLPRIRRLEIELPDAIDAAMVIPAEGAVPVSASSQP